MNEIRLIFNEVFKDYEGNNLKYAILILSKDKKSKIIFSGAFALYLLINLINLFKLMGSSGDIDIMFRFSFELLFSSVLFGGVVMVSFYFLIKSTLDEKIQKEFLPQLTQEQVDLLVFEKAVGLLKEGEWNDLSWKQATGLECISKSLTHDEVKEFVKVDVLTHIGEENE